MNAKAKTRYGLHSVSGFCLQEKSRSDLDFVGRDLSFAKIQKN